MTTPRNISPLPSSSQQSGQGALFDDDPRDEPEPTKWTTIRIPRHVRRLIATIEAETVQALTEGRILDFPGWDPDREAVAAWGIVEKALRDFHDHRRRSRARKAR